MAVFTAIIFTSFSILFPQFSWGNVLTDEISEKSLETFTLKEFCQEMVTHPSPLIDVKSKSVVDCMGKKVKVDDFCLKKMATDPYYLRGYAEDGKVYCVSGKKVIFRYLCSDKKNVLCRVDARAACLELKSRMAHRLDLIHSSLIDKMPSKQLNCFFESLPLKHEKNN